jgi:hypothetical protein
LTTVVTTTSGEAEPVGEVVDGLGGVMQMIATSSPAVAARKAAARAP